MVLPRWFSHPIAPVTHVSHALIEDDHVADALNTTGRFWGELAERMEIDSVERPHPIADAISLAGVGEIEHTMPPSSTGWVIACLVATCVAAVLFVVELMSVNWGDVAQADVDCGCTVQTKTAANSTVASEEKPAGGKSDGGEKEGGDDLKYGKNRWMTLIFMLVLIGSTDLYNGMPLIWFPGAAQSAGVGLTFAGFYVGASPMTACLASMIAGPLLAVWSANTLVRTMVAMLALVSIPQGIANQFGPTGFMAICAPLRLLEGFAMGIAETSMASVIFRLFPPSEAVTAIGLVMASRGLVGICGPALGALLYSTGGMAMPYLLCGGLNLVTVILARLFMEPIKPHGQPSATVMTLLKIPRFVATIAMNFVVHMLAPMANSMARERAPPRTARALMAPTTRTCTRSARTSRAPPAHLPRTSRAPPAHLPRLA
jgi:hypothetical protein